MKKYNLRKLMLKAWALYRAALKKGAASFSAALKLAWKWLKVQDSNRAAINAAAAAAGLADQVYHTWYGWTLEGRKVMHEEKAVFQVEIEDPTTKSVWRLQSFFTYEQTYEQLN